MPHVASDFLASDFLASDFLASDFLASDFLASDFWACPLATPDILCGSLLPCAFARAVFDVDIGDGVPVRKLPYNFGGEAWGLWKLRVPLVYTSPHKAWCS